MTPPREADPNLICTIGDPDAEELENHAHSRKEAYSLKEIVSSAAVEPAAPQTAALIPPTRAAGTKVIPPELFAQLFITVDGPKSPFYFRFRWETSSPFAGNFK